MQKSSDGKKIGAGDEAGLKVKIGPKADEPFTQKARAAKGRKAYDNAKYRCSNDASYSSVKFLFGSYAEFLQEVGLPTHPDHSLDRIDPAGHYCPGNVRWAPKAIQSFNKMGAKFQSAPTLSSLMQQVQQHQALGASRQRAQISWNCWVAALNRGALREDDLGQLAGLPHLFDASFDITDARDVFDPPGVFHMPSLSIPGACIRMRGFPPNRMGRAGDECTGLGILSLLKAVPLETNVPGTDVAWIRNKLDDAAGFTWVGQPDCDALLGGWIEGRFLAVASRLSKLGQSVFFAPAIGALRLLENFGHPKEWPYIAHPLLRARHLFVPDYEVDDGPTGNLVASDQYGLHRLAEMRKDAGLITWVGIQNPNRVPKSAHSLLLGAFEVRSLDCSAEVAHPISSTIAHVAKKGPPSAGLGFAALRQRGGWECELGPQLDSHSHPTSY